MRSIRIERYAYPGIAGYAGLIEAVDDRNRGWILYLDDVGRPAVYFAERDPDTGAVIGEAIPLQPLEELERLSARYDGTDPDVL